MNLNKLTAEERWEQGIEHHPKSLIIQKGLKDQDTHGIWDWGGDGDNGEDLLYQLDVIFSQEEINAND